MTVYFDRLKVGYPDDHIRPEDWDGCWRVYTICETNNGYSCTTRADARLMVATNDLLDARRSWGSLLQKAHMGGNFSALYDEKQCHDVHTFKFNNVEHKIWRIRGSGDIRMYFIYLPDMRIVLLRTEPKRKPSLRKAEKKQLADMSIEVMNCVAAHTFEMREL